MANRNWCPILGAALVVASTATSAQERQAEVGSAGKTAAVEAPGEESQSDAENLETIKVRSTREEEAVVAKDEGASDDVRFAEIVVTARRTSESLQRVPIAVTVLDGKALSEKGIATTTDLGTAVPGLTGASFYSSTRTTFTIRGQGEAYGGSLPGVLSYFAEVPDFSSFVYDLQDVQVLKGPQGTLFGKNTTGGAVLFTPARPTSEFSGFLNARGGDYRSRNLEFGVGGPVVGDVLSLRLAGQVLRTDGYAEDTFDNQDLSDIDRQSFRLSALYAPTDYIDSLTLVQDFKVDQHGPGYVLVSFLNQPTTPYFLELGPYLAAQKQRGPHRLANDADNSEKGKGYGAFNATTVTLSDEYAIKNIASYKREELALTTDLDGSSFRLLSTFADPKLQAPEITWTEEAQLQFEGKRMQAVAGVFLDRKRQDHNRVDVDIAAPGSTSAAPVTYNFIIRGAPQSASRAVFAQGGLKDFLIEDLSLTLGARYTRDRRQSTQSQAAEAGAVNAATLPETRFKLKSGATTANVSLDYQATSDVLVYGTVRRGYKAGGFNVTADTSRVKYDPEYVLDFEIGVKTEFYPGNWRVRLNSDLFYDEYRDIQRNLYLSTVPPTQVVSNAAAATIKGLDIDLLLGPASWTDIALQYTLVDASYQEYRDEQFGDLSNSKFPSTPRHQLTFTPAGRFELPGQWGQLSTSATLFWQSKQALFIPNTPNGTPANDQAVPGSNGVSFRRLDVRADWRRIRGSGFSIGAFGRNLTDEVYEVGSINSQAVTIVGVAAFIYGPPRMFGAELRYDF